LVGCNDKDDDEDLIYLTQQPTLVRCIPGRVGGNFFNDDDGNNDDNENNNDDEDHNDKDDNKDNDGDDDDMLLSLNQPWSDTFLAEWG